MKKLFGGLLGCVLGLALASDAQAIIWPSNSQWIPLKVGGSNYVDAVGDYNPETVDIVGGIDTLGSNHSAGFYFTDPTNMMFRMRVDNPFGATLPQAVWSILIDTNHDFQIEWILQLDGKNDNQVEFTQANTITDFSIPSGYVGDVNPHTNNWALADFSRTNNASLITGSQFHINGGDDDYFVDIAMPIADFFRISGATNTTPLYIALGTSTDDVNLNKDRPDVATYFSDPIFVPEPSALALASVGAVVLGCFRRRRH